MHCRTVAKHQKLRCRSILPVGLQNVQQHRYQTWSQLSRLPKIFSQPGGKNYRISLRVASDFSHASKACVGHQSTHLYFMFSKEYWFREVYLGLKVTASFDRSESYTRIIDGQVRCITPDFKPKDLQVAWNVQFITVFVSAWLFHVESDFGQGPWIRQRG